MSHYIGCPKCGEDSLDVDTHHCDECGYRSGGETIDIVFDGPPGPEAGRFVEVENMEGESIKVGEWVKREDGYWVLRIPGVQL